MKNPFKKVNNDHGKLDAKAIAAAGAWRYEGGLPPPVQRYKSRYKPYVCVVCRKIFVKGEDLTQDEWSGFIRKHYNTRHNTNLGVLPGSNSPICLDCGLGVGTYTNAVKFHTNCIPQAVPEKALKLPPIPAGAGYECHVCGEVISRLGKPSDEWGARVLAHYKAHGLKATRTGYDSQLKCTVCGRKFSGYKAGLAHINCERVKDKQIPQPALDLRALTPEPIIPPTPATSQVNGIDLVDTMHALLEDNRRLMKLNLEASELISEYNGEIGSLEATIAKLKEENEDLLKRLAAQAQQPSGVADAMAEIKRHLADNAPPR